MIYEQVEKEYLEGLRDEAKRLQVENEYLLEWIKYLRNRALVERIFDIDRFLPISIHPKYKNR